MGRSSHAAGVGYESISDIRVIRGFPNFPCNGRSNFAQYISERLELTSQVRVKEGQNNKRKLNKKETIPW